MARRYAPRLLTILACLGAAVLLAPGDPHRPSPGAWAVDAEAPFEIALMGDAPYSTGEEAIFEAMLEEIGRNDLAFAVHVGDFKSSRMPCSDELYARRLALFKRFFHPFVFVFGDNEWTDCHLSAAGGYDPVERLERLRELFAAGEHSLGRRPMPLERQGAGPQWPKFRENVRWTRGGVVFVGLNVPGSNNNFGRVRASNAEYFERNAANLAWMRDSFAVAVERRAPGILLAIQADPFFELPRGDVRRSGFESFLEVLERETVRFGKPVVLVHGDTHMFRIDKPLQASSGRTVANFTRVEVFGSPIVSWVRGRVTPRGPEVFSFQPGAEGPIREAPSREAPAPR